jgi:hypothetical protein
MSTMTDGVYRTFRCQGFALNYPSLMRLAEGAER